MSAKDEMRAEICKALLEGEFTAKTCSTVMRMTEAARDFLRAQSVKPEDFEAGTTALGLNEGVALSGSFNGPMNQETFGAKMMRELIANLPALMQQSRTTPRALVDGIAAAKEANLPEVEASLKKQLGVALDAEVVLKKPLLDSEVAA